MSIRRKRILIGVVVLVILAYVAITEVRVFWAHEIGWQAIQRVNLTEQTLNEHAFEIANNRDDIRTANQVNNDQWDQLTDRHSDQIEHRKRIEALEQK